MPPDRTDLTELGLGDARGIGLDVLGWEEEVAGERHQRRRRSDAAQGCVEITTGCQRDVTGAPLGRLAQQVVRVHRQEVSLEESLHEPVARGETQLAPDLVTVDGGGAAHQRERLRVAAEPDVDVLGSGVEPVRERGVTTQGLGVQVDEDHAVLGVAGRRGERHGARERVRIAHCPLQGLLAAHRPATDHGQPADAEVLGDQPVLSPDVVGDRDRRERAPVERRRGVAR